MLQASQVANRLIELCGEGQFLQAQQALYAPGIIRIELDGSSYEGLPTMMEREINFLKGIEMIEYVHYSRPFLAGDYFSVHMEMKVHFKEIGIKILTEICIYKVQEGKIIFEQFFGSPQ